MPLPSNVQANTTAINAPIRSQNDLNYVGAQTLNVGGVGSGSQAPAQQNGYFGVPIPNNFRVISYTFTPSTLSSLFVLGWNNLTDPTSGLNQCQVVGYKIYAQNLVGNTIPTFVGDAPASPCAVTIPSPSQATKVIFFLQPYLASGETLPLSACPTCTGQTVEPYYEATFSGTTVQISPSVPGFEVSATNISLILNSMGLSLVDTGVASVALGPSASSVAFPISYPVTLSFNRQAVYSDGGSFLATTGVDGAGNAYSQTLLSSVFYNSNVSFLFTNSHLVNSGIACSSQVLGNPFSGIPASGITYMALLATGVNGAQASQNIVVTYTDSSTATFTQSYSNWLTPSSFSGENIAATQTYYDTHTGGRVNANNYIYAYFFPLNAAKSVQKVTLPANSNLVIFSLTFVVGSLTAPAGIFSINFSDLAIVADSTAPLGTGSTTPGFVVYDASVNNALNLAGYTLVGINSQGVDSFALTTQNNGSGTLTLTDGTTSNTNTLQILSGSASSATGGAQTLPANPVGFLLANLGGTSIKIPYYNA